ncbi:conserved hypothetical protein [Culex quinquefasciatus]|uniref:Uncharacterized protein n=1 Tax=Culex quinquefasciatus TaxID=7176 RepID=B0XBW5_CULQU|nr:conserved hypothetical protein [Culex quinquefasciatus]|eukprot:XP_001867137.1 conserved hypothetical protein [Culex quinquefasciatus]
MPTKCRAATKRIESVNSSGSSWCRDLQPVGGFRLDSADWLRSQRNQQPDESNEDFVQAVNLQAELCGFGAFRDVAIMDRVLAGLLDENLKENLLKEEGLTLDKMDKFITTWNIAKRYPCLSEVRKAKISLNTFHVSAGSAVWLAHRDQLKPHYQQQGERPNLMTPFEKSAPDAAVVDLEVEMLNLDEDMLRAGYGGSGLFRGFPEAATARSRSRKRDASAAELPAVCLRRSKRIKKPVLVVACDSDAFNKPAPEEMKSCAFTLGPPNDSFLITFNRRLLFRRVMEVVTGLMEVEDSAVMRVATVAQHQGKPLLVGRVGPFLPKYVAHRKNWSRGANAASSVAKFLERYGEFRDVYEEQLGDDQEFVGVYTGIRVAKMVVRENIGSWITINGEDTKCQYYAQKATCKHCHDYLDIGVGCVQNKKLLVQKNFADAVKQPTKPAMPQLQPNPQQPLNPQKPKPKPNGGKLKPSGGHSNRAGGGHPMMLQNRGDSYKQQVRVGGWAGDAPSSAVNMKLLWAPIVDSLYWSRFNLRKSWLIPTKYLIGLFMLILRLRVNRWLENSEGDDVASHVAPNIPILMVIFIALNFLAATVGQTARYFLGYVAFMALESAEFCNSYLRPEPVDEGLVTFQASCGSGDWCFW